MRLTKMFGLAAVAAVAAIAFVGASSAMATETAICKVHTSLVCPEGQEVESIKFVAGTTILKTSIATVLCLHSKAKAVVEGELLTAPLKVLLEELDFLDCGTNSTHTNCTVTTEQLPLLEVLKTALNLGAATVNPELPAKVHVECGELINCTYSGPVEGKSFHVEGANETINGMLTANELEVEKVGGILCPKVSKWTALYEPGWAGTTQLCWAHEEPCAEKNRVGEFTVLATKEVLKTNIITVLCLHSKAKAEAEEPASTRVKVTELTWNECGTNSEHNNCTVTNLSLPLLDVLKTALNNGIAIVLGAEINVKCGKLINCTYSKTIEPLIVEGSEASEGVGNGMLTANELEVEKVGGLFCPKTSKWTALYEGLTLDEKPIYILE